MSGPHPIPSSRRDAPEPPTAEGLRATIENAHPLEDAFDALESFAAGAHGKIVLLLVDDRRAPSRARCPTRLRPRPRHSGTGAAAGSVAPWQTAPSSSSPLRTMWPPG